MSDHRSKAVVARRRSQRKPSVGRSAKPPQRKRRTFRSEPSAPDGLQRKRRTRRLSEKTGSPWRRLAALTAVAGLLALLAWLFGDGSFYVSKADITGLRNSSASEIYRQAGIDGYSIFWVNSRDVAGRLEALPYVKGATVHTSLPNRVRIAVEERDPVAVWKAGGRDFWVDIEGITMPVASQVDALPVLWDLDGSTVVAGGQVDRELIAATRALKLEQPNVTDFGYDRTHGLQFRMPTGTIVYLGKPDGLGQRVEELVVLQQSLASEGRSPVEINWRVEDGFYLK